MAANGTDPAGEARHARLSHRRTRAYRDAKRTNPRKVAAFERKAAEERGSASVVLLVSLAGLLGAVCLTSVVIALLVYVEAALRSVGQ